MGSICRLQMMSFVTGLIGKGNVAGGAGILEQSTGTRNRLLHKVVVPAKRLHRPADRYENPCLLGSYM
jgi:hypothetical protein